MNQSKYISLIVSSIVFWGSFLTTFILNFKYRLPDHIIIASVFDWLLTTLVFFFILKIYKSRIQKLNDHLQLNLRCFINRNRSLFSLITLITFLYFYSRLNLIMSGVTREQLVFEEETSRFMMFASPFFVVFSAISIVYNYKFIIKVACVLGVFFTSSYNLSRSEFANLIFLIIICLSLKGISFKGLIKLCILAVSIIIIVGILTIYQGRADTIDRAINGVMISFFKYKAFSFYLAEYSIEKISNDFEHIFYPFFGFFIERTLILIEPISNPISVYNADFISELRRLGPSNEYDGNVLYPWWSWFYGLYGIIGIFLKAIFSFILISTLLRTKLYLLTLYTIYAVLFLAYFRHPALNAASVYAIILFLFIDIIIIIYNKYIPSTSTYK